MTGSKSRSEPEVRNRRIRIAGVATALLAALLLILAGRGRTDDMLFDAWQRLRPADLSGTRVHVVWIDPPSLAAVGPWPWPRYHLARLVEEIAARGATVIGLDMLFPEPDRLNPELFAALYPELPTGAAAEVRALPSLDETFATAIGRHPVVLGRAGIGDRAMGSAGPLPVEAEFSAPLPGGMASFPRAIANIPALDEVAIGHGLLNGPPDPDGIVRRLPMAATVAGQPTPGFALELARIALGAERIDLHDSAARVGSRRIPVDADGSFRPRFGSFPPAQISSAAEVLRRGFPRDAFAGQVVLVGLASEGTQDVVATPLGAETFGVLVQAQAVDAILRGGWLSRPAWAPALEWTFGILIAGWLLWLVPFRRRWIAFAPLLAGIAILAGCWLAFDLASLLIDPLPPLALGGATAAGLFAMSFAEARHERERLRDSLLRERLSAAETAGELQAARDIQLGMLPPRRQLAELDPRLDLDAMLEPARSVGGDFYDALRLGRHVIGFVVGDVTGKGLSAALFMTVSKALTRSVMLREEGDLASAAAMLDRELSRDDNPYMGVTMLMGFIDLATGAATFCNAGHENPVLIAADGSVCDLPMEGGPPFCAIEGFAYPAERMRVAPGETLVLVTDGVTEARSASGELFGRVRLLETLQGCASAGEAVERVAAAVRDFEAGADPTDDLTVLAFRFLGPDAA